MFGSPHSQFGWTLRSISWLVMDISCKHMETPPKRSASNLYWNCFDFIVLQHVANMLAIPAPHGHQTGLCAGLSFQAIKRCKIINACIHWSVRLHALARNPAIIALQFPMDTNIATDSRVACAFKIIVSSFRNKETVKKKHPAGLETGRVKYTYLTDWDQQSCISQCLLKVFCWMRGSITNVLHFYVWFNCLFFTSGEEFVPEMAAPAHFAGDFTSWPSKRLFSHLIPILIAMCEQKFKSGSFLHASQLQKQI